MAKSTVVTFLILVRSVCALAMFESHDIMPASFRSSGSQAVMVSVRVPVVCAVLIPMRIETIP
jgi:hypothetical protein